MEGIGRIKRIAGLGELADGDCEWFGGTGRIGGVGGMERLGMVGVCVCLCFSDVFSLFSSFSFVSVLLV